MRSRLSRATAAAERSPAGTARAISEADRGVKSGMAAPQAGSMAMIGAPGAMAWRASA